jgi:maltooligosyltrehalose synthase
MRLLVAVPRLVHQLHQENEAADWGSTEIVLPREARWRDVLTGRTLDGRERVFAGVLFADFPVSVLAAEIGD